MKYTYISVGYQQEDKIRQEKLERMIKSGIKKCKGHKVSLSRPMFDDETIKTTRLFEEQCGVCGGYKV